MTGLKLDGHKEISLCRDLVVNNKPKEVIIPIANHTNLTCNILVKKGEEVKKGQIIGERKDIFYVPIFSSVSGEVVDIVDTEHQNGEEIKGIKIKNDFKETKAKKDIDKLNYEIARHDLINIIKDNGIVGMGGSGFPTYVKYDHLKDIDYLVINAAECEPYITADFALMDKYLDEVLLAIRKIIDVMAIKEVAIGIRKNETEYIKKLEDKTKDDKKIKVVPVADHYPAGWERKLIKETLNLEYTRLPLEKGIIINNVTTMYAIYYALKYGQPLTEKIITVSGEKVEEPVNIETKIGTQVKDLLKLAKGKEEVNSRTRLIFGGPMLGNSISNDSVPVGSSINCVLSLDSDDAPSTRCLRCGKCSEVCPCGLTPVEIKNNITNVKELKSLHPELCSQCGLCSYICPSKIKVRDFVIKAGTIVRKVK